MRTWLRSQGKECGTKIFCSQLSQKMNEPNYSNWKRGARKLFHTNVNVWKHTSLFSFPFFPWLLLSGSFTLILRQILFSSFSFSTNSPLNFANIRYRSSVSCSFPHLLLYFLSSFRRSNQCSHWFSFSTLLFLPPSLHTIYSSPSLPSYVLFFHWQEETNYRIRE